MTVTTIQDLTKKKSKIVFDSGESIVLYKGEISKYRIVCDEEISPSSYDEIMNIVLPKRAKLRAMNLLKSRPYTTRKLRDKLMENGYPQSIIDIAMDYVSSFGYIDDTRYVMSSEANEGSELLEEEQIRKYLAKKGFQDSGLSYEDKAKLKASLYRKGYDPNLIDRII